jgi:hypothetical protein
MGHYTRISFKKIKNMTKINKQIFKKKKKKKKKNFPEVRKFESVLKITDQQIINNTTKLLLISAKIINDNNK